MSQYHHHMANYVPLVLVFVAEIIWLLWLNYKAQKQDSYPHWLFFVNTFVITSITCAILLSLHW